MNEIDRNALKEFLLDINCLKELDKWENTFNMFDVLKITNMEIRHSNILAWLFDPNENHFLGDAFIKEFIRRLSGKLETKDFDLFSLLLQDFYSYQVYRELNHMDIVLCSREEKTAIIIENKVWSSESTNQLKKYYEKCQTEYSDCDKKIFVFLTPQGDEPSDPEHWLSFSYEEIIEALEYLVSNTELIPEVSLLINDYIDTVRRNIMQEKDEELVRICNEIYNKHRTALRLIFENVKIDDSLESEIICGTLKELNDEGKIIYNLENRWTFFTKKMDEFLPPMETPISSWKTNYIYAYWFEIKNDYLYIHFELGLENLNDEQNKNTELIIKAADNKGSSKRYRRLYYKKAPLEQENYETSLQNAVKELVDAALKKENMLLNKIVELEKEQ